MAPSYDNLPDDNMEEEELDFSDLNEQYEVRLESSLDAFCVIDGLPVVPEDSKPKLVKYIQRKLNQVGKISEDGFFMPLNNSGSTQGFGFVEYATADQATAAVKQLNGTALDKKHIMSVNKLTDIDRYGREGRVNEEYEAPQIEPFKEKEHLRWFLEDRSGRDQFAMIRGDNCGVFWNERDEAPENMVDRAHWTDSFVSWSHTGVYLASLHTKGVLCWGGPSWTRLKRFAHPGVNLIDFSPHDNWICTWSHRPIELEPDDKTLSAEEEGKNYIIWDVATGKPLRSFQNIEQAPAADEEGRPVKKRLQWPAFKWSADDKYVARMTPGQSLSIYELPRMNLLDKTSVKIEGLVDFEWCPATPQRDAIRTYEQLIAFWQPELGSNPAKVGLMSIPSKEIVRTTNLFNVSDAKLHWQSSSTFLCVKVDRHSKSKKSLTTNLEIFRIREKGVPVEVVDQIKDQVINFAWEPDGARFVVIVSGEVLMNSAVPPKTSVSFFCPEKSRTAAVGKFRHIKTIEKRNSNAIYWSPKGRIAIVATVQSAQSHELDFYDFDYEGDKNEADEKLSANLQLMSSADHFSVTDVEWSADGRYVITSGSMWKNAMETGYHLYDFKGQLLREEHIDRFRQVSWRPRPALLLSKDEQKQIRKNLREYSKTFDEEDIAKKTTASRAVIEHRRRLLEEWYHWRAQTETDLAEMREDKGLPPNPRSLEMLDDMDEEEEGKVVEEIVEEIIRETEEVV
ncbi:MAG: Translation initiation factor 3 subunit b [Chrysothrix sp. TS-e1954]|nr:MAG: Translation initiation factor 3 subunit b [Chrysothrix sp. TS-e1954]